MKVVFNLRYIELQKNLPINFNTKTQWGRVQLSVWISEINEYPIIAWLYYSIYNITSSVYI